MASTENSLNRPEDLASQLTTIVERAVRMTASNGAMIALRQNNGLVTFASSGQSVPEAGTPVRPTSFAGRAFLEEALLTCADTEGDPRVDAAACRALNVRSMIAAPISSDGRLAGVLAVFASRPNRFVEDGAGLVRTLATIVGEILRVSERPLATIVGEILRVSERPLSASPSESPSAVPAVTTANLADTEPLPDVPVRIPPSTFEPLKTPEPEIVEQTLPIPESGPAVAAADVQVLPDITVVPLHPDTKEDPNDLLFLPSFAQEEPAPRRRTGLKLALVLLVVAALAAGQWMLRGRIVKIIRSRFAPASSMVQPAAPAPVPAPQPVVAQSLPTASSETAAPMSAGQTFSGETLNAAGRAYAPAASERLQTGTPVANRFAANAASATPAEVRPPQLLSRVEPVSPPGLRAESAVALNATVLRDGSIGKVTVVSGEPGLQQAAIAAVKRWKYRPAYLHGQPVEVSVPIEVTFKAQVSGSHSGQQ